MYSTIFKRKYFLFYKFCEAFHSCDTVHKLLTPNFLSLPYEILTRVRWGLYDFSKHLERCNWRMIESTVCLKGYGLVPE